MLQIGCIHGGLWPTSRLAFSPGAAVGLPYPLPFVAVSPGRAWDSKNPIIWLATSIPVAPSTPSSPGDEFTSMTIGPRDDRSISTPLTFNPSTEADLTAVAVSSGSTRLARHARRDAGSSGTRLIAQSASSLLQPGH